ncbi:ROK family protein [Candidatus Neomarinimicrobiota bacterium]
MAVIGIDVGGSKLAGALLTVDGTMRSKDVKSVRKRSGSEVGLLITSQINDLFEAGAKENIPVESIGVCVPGIYYARTGNVWAPNIRGWDDYPLLSELSKYFESKDIPITIDSDRACYILGETWLGAAKDCRDAIFMAVGTGIGAGILVNGEILRGHGDIAGAVGWMALNRPFKEEYTDCGCFEYHTSGEGIAKVAQRLLIEQPDISSVLQKVSPEDLTARHVFKAFEAGDLLATRVIDECVEFWGMATANLVSVFNPEKIIFGGGIFGPATRFLDRIQKEARRWAQPISFQHVMIEASTLGGDAGLLGAGNLAMRNLKDR